MFTALVCSAVTLSYIRATTGVSNRTCATDSNETDFDFAQTSSHPSGTAALGPRANGGVVDANLVVYGTRNLRVFDAGIIPMIVGANLQETVYAIGEKVGLSARVKIDCEAYGTVEFALGV